MMSLMRALASVICTLVSEQPQKLSDCRHQVPQHWPTSPVSASVCAPHCRRGAIRVTCQDWLQAFAASTRRLNGAIVCKMISGHENSRIGETSLQHAYHSIASQWTQTKQAVAIMATVAKQMAEFAVSLPADTVKFNTESNSLLGAGALMRQQPAAESTAGHLQMNPVLQRQQQKPRGTSVHHAVPLEHKKRAGPGLMPDSKGQPAALTRNPTHCERV